ncbi:hypothetical protein LSH36_301g03037 [Paralvinella palmiformis]|uniref:Uncharacterized protein n=1 Tax=Paralvinella palmiformis TaxID=53620 RepID=A0AAD9N3V3_9ANNE|nr:hypothetical protein LSH36_301g03037 [Paralvinella palmiformis]
MPPPMFSVSNRKLLLGFFTVMYLKEFACDLSNEQAVKGIQTDDSELGFIPGDKCRVTLDGRTFIAHIQEIEPEHGPTTVFIEELGEK